MSNEQNQTAEGGPLQRRVMPTSEASKLTARQKRMQHAIRYMANYMSTYEKQPGCLDYRDETLIDDVLYGLGYALGGKEHQYASGFDVWKDKLRKHLDQKE